MAENAYLAFLRDPDQASRRVELETFIGSNAAPFMKVYDRLQQDAAGSASGRAKMRLLGGGFCAPAFFTGPVWFFYRKMWVIGAVVVGLFAALTLLPGTSRVGLPLAIIMALMGHRTYVQYAIGVIQKRRTAGGVDAETLMRAGGVSKVAGWVGGVIYGLLTLAGLAALIVLARSGAPLPQ